MRRTRSNGEPAWLCPLVLILFVMILQAGSLHAQVGGTISGYVKDPSGATIPGVVVTAELQGQQLVRSAHTNETGFFDLLALPRGTYKVKAEVSGFETQTQSNVVLTAGANVRLDFTLKVGMVTEQVTVESATPLVEARSATQSSLVDDRRVQDLPLSGRNVIALASIHSGITDIRANQDTDDGRAGPVMAVHGSNRNQSLYTLNGSVFTHFNQTTGFNPPPPDAVQEIRIQTHNFSAEYGQTAGGQISIVSRAGSNEFHGTAWEFHRNDKLNARSFFQSRRPGQRQNQAGASGGGPVIRNKLFLFGSYQRLWDRREAGSSQVFVPTDAQRTGNFTALTKKLKNPLDPYKNQPYKDAAGNPCLVDNVIRPGCISPVAKLLLDKYIPASSSGVVNILRPSPRNNETWMLRGDYNLSVKNQLNAHFFADKSDSSSWPGNLNYVEQTLFSNIYQAAVSDTHTINPNFINEASFSYLKADSGGGAVTQLSSRDLGVNMLEGPDGRAISFSVTGGVNLTYPGVNGQKYTSWQLRDTMTFVSGNHTFKWGYDMIKPSFHFNLALTRTATFAGTMTGDATADFMLGAFDRAQIEYGIADHDPVSIKHNFFFEDSFKVSPRFTMNYGVRWEPFIAWDQETRRHNSWVPGVQSTVVPDAPKGILFPGDAGLPERLMYNDYNNFAPRLGLAWDVAGNGRTVIRAGYGIFLQQVNGETTHAAEAPFRSSTLLRQGRIEDPFVSVGQTQPSVDPPGKFGCSPISAYPGLNCTLYPVPMRIVWSEQRLKTPYMQHFSLSIQRQVGVDWVVETSYVGKIARKLVGHNYFNAAPFINSPITGKPPSLQNIEERVPFSPGIISAQSRVLGNYFDSWYHAFQMRVERRFSKGVSLQGSYTLSKNLSNQPEDTTGQISSIPNPFDIDSMKGRSLLDRRHVLAFSWVWSPEYRVDNKLLSALLQGWTVTGLHRIQSGQPLVFTMGTDVAQNGILQPNGQYALLDAGATAETIKRDHADRTDMIRRFFNTDGFVPVNSVPRGIYGNAARGLISGPSDMTSDFSVLRHFPIWGERVRMQVRGEFFNAFNQVNFSDPTTNLSSSNFGRITGADSGRVVQVAVKIIW